MASPVRCETLYNRLCRCAHFTEKETYLRTVGIIFKRVLKEYARDTSISFYSIFSRVFSTNKYTGPNKIYDKDKQEFKEYCVQTAINMNTFLEGNTVTKILDKYTYNYKVSGNIGGIVEEKDWNVQFSFTDLIFLQKSVDFYCLNNYIYNVVKNTTNNCLIMNVPTDSYFYIEYNENDYTIKRGYLSSIIHNKMRRRGDHCTRCKNTCKPLFINGIKRLEGLL